MAALFSPLTLKSISLRNRIAVSPMCQYSSVDGFANDWHLVHLGSRATGGAGLVITEATAVSPEGRISAHDLGIWKDDHIAYLQRITSFIHSQNAVAGIQLAHAGRKASHARPWDGGQLIASSESGWQTLAPSAIPFKPNTEAPSALTIEGIRQVIRDFKSAAERALQAGFKLIEIHAAHGYLLHQFFSPLSNFRTDEYGGSFKNRVRLLLEIVDAVHSVWPATLPVIVRISATDWVTGGWDMDESVQLCFLLKEKGIDLVDTSSGGLSTLQQIPLSAGYQVPFATRIKKETGLLTGAVGLITTAQQAEDIVAQGEADLVLLARELLRDPYFPLHAAHQLEEQVHWPLQYERAKPH